MIDGLTPAENVRVMIDRLGLTEEEAELIVVIETGETDGDVVTVDAHGREIRRQETTDGQ